MRTLLILTFHFPPSAAVGGRRLLGFCRHLPRFGWNCQVVAPEGLPWEPTDLALQARVPPDTSVHYVSFTAGLYSMIVRRIKPIIFESWLLKAWFECRRIIRQERPEAILTSGPPHAIHLLGRSLHKQYGIPWIADFRDPWTWTARLHDPFTRNVREGFWKDRWNQAMERAVITESDAIIANSPQSHAALAAAYPADVSRMEMITNGFDPDQFVDLAGPDATDPVVHLRYSGEIYAGRDPRPFFDALRIVLEGRPHGARAIHTTFIGLFDPSARTATVAEARCRGLEGTVVVQNQVSHADSLAAMARASILLLIDTPGRRIGVPAKLYEYIGTGRPILALVEPDSDAAWVLRESGAPYRLAPPTDPEAIGQALTELLDMLEIGPPITAPQEQRSRFTRQYMTGRLVEVLDRCTGRDPRPIQSPDADAEALDRAGEGGPPETRPGNKASARAN